MQSRAVTSHLHEVREFEAVREISFTVQGLRYYCLRSGNFETLRHLNKLTISDSKITNFYLDDLGLSKPAQMELVLKLPSVSKRLNDIIKEFYQNRIGHVHIELLQLNFQGNKTLDYNSKLRMTLPDPIRIHNHDQSYRLKAMN